MRNRAIFGGALFPTFSTVSVASFRLPLATVELALKRPPQDRRAGLRRPFHDDKASTLQMLNEALGDDLSHELVGVVDALAA